MASQTFAFSKLLSPFFCEIPFRYLSCAIAIVEIENFLKKMNKLFLTFSPIHQSMLSNCKITFFKKWLHTQTVPCDCAAYKSPATMQNENLKGKYPEGVFSTHAHFVLV